MQYDEHHLLTITDPDGRITSQQYDDPTEAHESYTDHALFLAPGARVELRRYTSVVLATASKER